MHFVVIFGTIQRKEIPDLSQETADTFKCFYCFAEPLCVQIILSAFVNGPYVEKQYACLSLKYNAFLSYIYNRGDNCRHTMNKGDSKFPLHDIIGCIIYECVDNIHRLHNTLYGGAVSVTSKYNIKA